MGIYRIKKNTNYVVLDRTALNDCRLSWKAKGIVSYMLSMPDDWTFYWEELSKHSIDGLASLKSGLKELKKYGYLVRYPVKDNKTGKIEEWETVVYESPQAEYPPSGNPPDGKPVDGKPPSGKSPATNYLSLLSTEEPIIDPPSINIPYADIIEYLNQQANKAYKTATKKTKECIHARWEDGFRLDDFKKVIDNKVADWLNDDEKNLYLRPETLFGTKFEGYLNQKRKGVQNNGESVYDNLW